MSKETKHTTGHRHIPELPECPVSHPFIGHIVRSYPVGRKHYSRAVKGQVLSLTITKESDFPEGILANLITTINTNGHKGWNTVPFISRAANILCCELTPVETGIHSFRVEFSVDGGQTWVRDNVPDSMVVVDPPQVDGLILYTLIPKVSGTITAWKKDLVRIKKMGFNAVHILPVTALDSSLSPYSANDFFTIEPSYLDPESDLDGHQQMEAFIEEAKKLGIRLCFDIVLNHVGVESRMVKKAPDWIVPDEDQEDGFERAGYWAENGWNTWDDLVLINYEHPSETIRAEIWSYMSDYALFWAKYANDTGGFLRFDNLHSSHPGFILHITAAIRSEFPGLAVLAEFFTDESTLLSKSLTWGLNLNLATPWNFKFVPQLRDYMIYLNRVSRQIRFFMPVTSHDSGTPEQEFGTADSTIPRYVAAALMGSGATGITQGVEYGIKEKINFIGKKEMLVFPLNARFGLFIGKVNAILSSYKAFRRGDNMHFVDKGHDAVIAVYRRDEEEDHHGFLVISNFDTSAFHHLSVDLSDFLPVGLPIPFYELLASESGIFQEPKLELNLPPCAVRVYMLKRE